MSKKIIILFYFICFLLFLNKNLRISKVCQCPSTWKEDIARNPGHTRLCPWKSEITCRKCPCLLFFPASYSIDKHGSRAEIRATVGARRRDRRGLNAASCNEGTTWESRISTVWPHSKQRRLERTARPNSSSCLDIEKNREGGGAVGS